MTTYICAHPSHRRDDETRSIDVTPQVRLERSLTPRSPVYLAITEDVIRRVAALDVPRGQDRIAAVQQVLTGDRRPSNSPVLLVSGRNTDRRAGMYELDELARTDEAVGALATRWLEQGTRDDVIVVERWDGDDPGSQTSGVHMATRVHEPLVLPQGAFALFDLSIGLAQADRDEDAIAGAIRATPTIGPLRTVGTVEPWRVVITCPVGEGDPPITHRVLFTGDGVTEPPIVTGTPAGGRDAALETSASVDLMPAEAVARLERRNTLLLIGELAVLALGLGLGWASGALAFAVRETPGWFGFGVVMALTALVFAIVPRFAPNQTERNPDDTIEIGRFYTSRLDLLTVASAISAGALALALLCAIVPPSLVDRVQVGPPQISFDTSSRPVLARIQVQGGQLGTDDRIGVELREFDAVDATGVLVGHLVSSAGSNGDVTLDTEVALRSEARYLTVQTWSFGDEEQGAPSCTPADATGAGCTVVAIPPLGATPSSGTAGGVSSTVVVSTSEGATPSQPATPSSTAPASAIPTSPVPSPTSIVP